MNVWVRTVDGEEHTWQDATIGMDATVLQVTYKTAVTTFPLVNVLAFSTDEDTS